MTNRNEALMALAAEIRTSLGNEATASTRRRWAIEIEALASVPSAPVEVPDCMIVLLNHIETLMDNGRLEEDAIPTDMWNAVSTYNVTPQPAEGDGAMDDLDAERAEDVYASMRGDTNGIRALDSLLGDLANLRSENRRLRRKRGRREG